MILGILLAVFAGIILGFYALPEKFTKDYAFENTWGMFFFTAMVIFPLLALAIYSQDMLTVYGTFTGGDLLKMFISSFLWGVGMMMWGKAINHIGLSLGFSLFIGTIILVGSLLPFLVDGLPEKSVLIPILVGILVVLVGVIYNGKAGLERAKTEKQEEGGEEKGSMATGIAIAMVGGLLCTGFSLANTVGRAAVAEAAVSDPAINEVPEFVLGLSLMAFIYIVGALATVSYSVWQLSAKKNWSGFKTKYFARNTLMTTLMAVFNFGASIAFALAAIKLGAAGNTVGYAIFNTISVAVAAMGGLLTGEWKDASGKAKTYLYVGILGMILGVVVIAWGNGQAM
jgi:L-rhamnose-H+ transport protein